MYKHRQGFFIRSRKTNFAASMLQPFKQWIKKTFPGLVFRKQRSTARKLQLEAFLESTVQHDLNALSDASFDVFTYHGEDGIIGYLLRKLHPVKPVFADIGSGDCVKSNCACLATHYGWQGVFIDNDGRQLSVGKRFYRHNPQVRFAEAHAGMENVNALLESQGIVGEIGLLSVDIDGNDYWIWKAIEVISPAIVVIEAKVEFGLHDVIVPYSAGNHRSVDEKYNGASVKAFEKLGRAKGYRLAGANKQGYNLFFVKEEIINTTAEKILDTPGIQQSFYPDSFFAQHTFITA